MARQTMASLAAEVEHLRADNAKLTHALHALAASKPDTSEKIKLESDHRVQIDVYGFARAHGGLVVRLDYIGKQTPDVSVDYLDDMVGRYRNSLSRETLPVMEALARILDARNRSLSEPA